MSLDQVKGKVGEDEVSGAKGPTVRHEKLCDEVMTIVAEGPRHGPSQALPSFILTKRGRHCDCLHLPEEETEAQVI